MRPECAVPDTRQVFSGDGSELGARGRLALAAGSRGCGEVADVGRWWASGAAPAWTELPARAPEEEGRMGLAPGSSRGLAWGLARGVALHRAAVSGPGMLLRRQENPAVLPCASARCGATGDRRAPGAKSCLRVSHPGFFTNFRGIQASHKLPPGHPQTDVHASPPVTPSGCCRPWQPVPAPSLPLPS